MSETQNPSGTTETPPKSILMKEFEKLRRETAGINSLFENKTAGSSAGLVSNSILLEIRDMIGKMAEKQEKLEEKIEKIDEKVEKLKEESLESRRVQIEIKEQLKVTNQKMEGVHKDLDMKIQNTLKKLENSKEIQAENPKINEKAEISSVDISRGWSKFGEPLPVRSPRFPDLHSPEYIDVQLKNKYSDEVTPVKVKTTDKISILDGAGKFFGFSSPEYFIKDQNGEEKILDTDSIFSEANIKNGDVIFFRF